MSKQLIEALKEALRIVLISILPVAISMIETGKFDFKVLGIIAGVTFLRFVDKYMHELGKEEKDKVLTGGLTRF